MGQQKHKTKNKTHTRLYTMFNPEKYTSKKEMLHHYRLISQKNFLEIFEYLEYDEPTPTNKTLPDIFGLYNVEMPTFVQTVLRFCIALPQSKTSTTPQMKSYTKSHTNQT